MTKIYTQNKIMKKLLFLFLLIQILFASWSFAQNSSLDLEQINQDRLSLNSNGMLVLGGWAITNLAIGGIGMTQTNGRLKYFHQMNAMWNTVNLGIAGFGYYGLRNSSTNISLSETVREFHNFENILLFNAGLDVGYMAIGAYLWERGLRKESDRLVGYGQSMIVQGGFLFTFDVILYLLSKNQSRPLIESLENIQFTGTALSVTIPF
jgi:hypothetical protein